MGKGYRHRLLSRDYWGAAVRKRPKTAYASPSIRPLDAKTRSKRPAPEVFTSGAVYFGHQKAPTDFRDGGLRLLGLTSPSDSVQVHEERVSGARGETHLPSSFATLYVPGERSPVPRTGDLDKDPVGMWANCGL